MYRILTASKDTYITNKIVDSSFRATDGNVGRAGTIDLFKLYDESYISGSTEPIELSRALIKFDLDPIRAMTASNLNLNDPSLRCFIKLSDVYGGQSVPTNFKLILFPLSQSFDEGFGRDLSKYQDLDTANFLTASGQSVISLWNQEGADKQGLLGSSDIDIISSGVLDAGVGIQNLWAEQLFSSGEEDLYMDVTTIVSATVANLIPDCGFRISFSGSQETDNRTRFVKRFITRHSTNKRKTPRIIVTFDDNVQDNHENFVFDTSGSLFLNNTPRGSYANIVSGSQGTQITGSESLQITLTSGSFSESFIASQHTIAGNPVLGVYSASFAIQSNNALLKTEIQNAGSATFTEVWGSLDGTVPFLSSTLVIKSPNRTSFDVEQKRYSMNITNIHSVYGSSEKSRFRVHAQDESHFTDFKFSKLPFEKKSEIIPFMYYSIRDVNTGDVIIPFDRTRNTTRLSTDSRGMYFDLYMDSFAPGAVYAVDLLVVESNVEQIYKAVGGRFKVEK